MNNDLCINCNYFDLYKHPDDYRKKLPKKETKIIPENCSNWLCNNHINSICQILRERI